MTQSVAETKRYSGDPIPMIRTVWVQATRGRVPSNHIATGHTLAWYGDDAGSNCNAGVKQLCADLQCSRSTVLRSLGWLSENGWLSAAERGTRKLGENNSYRLTVPFDVAANLGWVEPEEEQPEEGEPEDDAPDVATNPFGEGTSHHATLQHMALISGKRDKLEAALLSSEEQFFAAIKRDWDARVITTTVLLGTYFLVTRQNKLPAFKKRWEAAGLPSAQKMNAIIKRESSVEPCWSGGRDHAGEKRPMKDQCVVYVLFDELDPVYVGSTQHFAMRFSEHRKTKEWTTWVAYPARDREHAYELEEKFHRMYLPKLNKKVGR